MLVVILFSFSFFSCFGSIKEIILVFFFWWIIIKYKEEEGPGHLILVMSVYNEMCFPRISFFHKKTIVNCKTPALHAISPWQLRNKKKLIWLQRVKLTWNWTIFIYVLVTRKMLRKFQWNLWHMPAFPFQISSSRSLYSQILWWN